MGRIIYKLYYLLKCELLKDDIKINYWGMDKYADVQKYIVNMLMLDKDDEVLDFGCGTGLILSHIADFCKKAVGLDHLKCMVKKAREYTRSKSNVDILYCNTSRLPFENNRFDKVFSWSVFEYFSSCAYAKIVLRELYRVVKPGGLIFIGDLPSIYSRQSLLKPTRESIPILMFTGRLINYWLYLYFDSYELKKFSDSNIGKTEIIEQKEFLPWNTERFDILVKVGDKVHF